MLNDSMKKIKNFHVEIDVLLSDWFDFAGGIIVELAFAVGNSFRFVELHLSFFGKMWLRRILYLDEQHFSSSLRFNRIDRSIEFTSNGFLLGFLHGTGGKSCWKRRIGTKLRRDEKERFSLTLIRSTGQRSTFDTLFDFFANQCRFDWRCEKNGSPKLFRQFCFVIVRTVEDC